MYVSSDEAERRLFRIGLFGALFGSLHIFSLLIVWFVTTDTLLATPVAGYNIDEALLLSIMAGAFGGLSPLVAAAKLSLSRMRVTEGGLLGAAAAFGLSSPVYSFLFRFKPLPVAGYYDIGWYISILTAVGILALAITAAVIPLKVELIAMSSSLSESPIPPREGSGAGRVQPVQQRRPVIMQTIDELPSGAMCSICYLPLEIKSTVKCSACGFLFHQGCIDTWADLNRECPNCKNPIQSTYPADQG